MASYETVAANNAKLAGKADLTDGKVPASQLPSYVDDVLEVSTYTSLPVVGEAGKIYICVDTNLTYRWTGTVYVAISSSLALGETSATAYAGDKGKVAYDHSQATGNAHSIPAVTTSAAGLMSSTDKTKLDSVASGATANAGTVTGVTATSPVVSSGGAAPVISMAAATNSVSGYLTAADHTTFLSKASTAVATTSANGLMSSTDKSKLDGLSSSQGSVTSIVASSPLTGGTITTSGTIGIPAATTSADGYMTAAQATKLAGVATGATANTGTVTSVTATGPVASTGGTTPVISMPPATSGNDGYMTQPQALKLAGIAAGATALTLGTTAATAYPGDKGQEMYTCLSARTSNNTASALVVRDASGNFSAGTISAALSGNATTATSATSVTGTVALANGGTGSTTAAGARTNLGLGNVTNAAATNANSPNYIVQRDSSCNFSAGTITANLTGNASGTAANVTGTVAVGNGGTGATTGAQALTNLGYTSYSPNIELTITSTLSLASASKTLVCTNTSAIVIAVPTNASVAFPTGAEVFIIRAGTGAVTVTPFSGVTVNGSAASNTIAAQFGLVALKKISTNGWILIGNYSEVI